jgi:hypothetical protein
MYMNCALVTIVGATSVRKRVASLVFPSRPSIFVANLQNGCSTIENTDVSFLDPGLDVKDVLLHLNGVTGICRPIAGIGAFRSLGGSTVNITAASSYSIATGALTRLSATTTKYPFHFKTNSASHLSTSHNASSQTNTTTSISNTVESASITASSTLTSL